MRRSRLTQIAPFLTAAKLKGVSVTVITRPPENFKESEHETVNQNAEYLNQYGVKVKFKPDFHQKFVIADQQIVWYGSVNFLSFGSHEESVMRFENEEIAGQLMDTVE